MLYKDVYTYDLLAYLLIFLLQNALILTLQEISIQSITGFFACNRMLGWSMVALGHILTYFRIHTNWYYQGQKSFFMQPTAINFPVISSKKRDQFWATLLEGIQFIATNLSLILRQGQKRPLL